MILHLSLVLATWIQGDFFRARADHVLDRLESFEPHHIRAGELIFVHPTYLSLFFLNVHPQITSPYILITHNSPTSIPDRYLPYLEDPKLIAWYGVNVAVDHPKLHLLPLGLPNRNKWVDPIESLSRRLPSSERPILLYLNFTDETHLSRSAIRKQFEGESYCTVAQMKKYEDYAADLAHSKFVLSPRGIGIDCYRTWEALIAGAIPIVLSSPLNPLFEDLPVLIVADWREISESFLQETYEAMGKREYKWEKLHGEFWLKELEPLR